MKVEEKGNASILRGQVLGNALGLKGNLKKSAPAMDVIKRFGELFRNGENISPKDFISYLSFGFIKAGKASFLPNTSNGMMYVREEKAKEDEKSEIFKTIFSAVSMMKGDDFEKFI